MAKKANRRDTLRLLGNFSSGLAISKIGQKFHQTTPPRKNIIVIVLDALTAHSMSLYGHVRSTTPTIENFSQQATVFHSHHSAGTFTTPGTASLLTGMYPWNHRAVNYRGLIERKYVGRNLFQLLGSDYFRMAFTQNMFAEILLTQFQNDIDLHIPIGSFSRLNQYAGNSINSDLMGKYLSYDGFLYSNRPGSLLFGSLSRFADEKQLDQMRSHVPGLESALPGLHFTIEDVVKGLANELTQITTPTFAYFHLYPPHDPYTPGPYFENLFQDEWKQPTKPRHPLAANANDNKTLNESRRVYEQYIARADSALAVLLHALEKSGLRDNSYIIITSDHGELFERGIEGHSSPLIYEGGIHVPLIISGPGQKERNDIYAVTNAVDLLPTILSMVGKEIPAWCEGIILPGFGGLKINNRITFTMDAKKSSANNDLSTITIAMRQGNYKLIFYKGYTNYKNYPKNTRYFDGEFELYNIISDPLELENLYKKETVIAKKMTNYLISTYETSRKPH